MIQEDTNDLFKHLSENDPKQLKQVIETLIAKSRVLIQNLEETWQKLEQSQTQKMFWKESYFHLREACQQYTDNHGLTPFKYIVSLQDELKKQKVYKSCLQQKFKVMKPNIILHNKTRPTNSNSCQKSYQYGDNRDRLRNTISSTLMKESKGEVRVQSRHKIGPKSIQFFKFREQRPQ